MHKFNRGSDVYLQMFFFDGIGLVLSFFVSYLICQGITFLYPITSYIWMPIIYLPTFLFTMSLSKMYNKLTFNYTDRIVKNIFKASFISGVFVGAMIFYTNNLHYSRIFYSVFMISVFLITVTHRIGFYYLNKKRTNKSMSKRVVIIGTQNVIDKSVYFMKKTNVHINIVGYIKVNASDEMNVQPILGPLDELENILKLHVVDEVIFAVGNEYFSGIEESVYLCENMGLTTRIVFNMFNLNLSKVHCTSLGTLPMLTLHTVSLNLRELFLKRTLDIIGATIGLLITSLVSIILIPLIKFTSPGPIFFTQDRVGMNGRLFKLYKFRSMYIDAEERKNDLMKQNKIQGGFMFKMDNDPRITRIGQLLRKTSLDELPQFLNILKGDMSLVGTRPPTVDEVKKYKTHHFRRISIKPGLTGMWQIKGRSEVTNFEAVVKLDTEYIDQWSVWLDIKIILKTILVVMNSRGAY